MKDNEAIHISPESWDRFWKSNVSPEAYSVEDFRDFFVKLGIKKWTDAERKKVSPKVARFIADYFRTKNTKFNEAFSIDSLYLRIPSTIQEKNLNRTQIFELIRKLLLFSKKSVISYKILSCSDSLDGWWFIHEPEFGRFRDDYPMLLKHGDVLFLPNTVLLGSGIKKGKKQNMDTVFNIEDLELYDINLNREDIWNYFVNDKPFDRSGSLSLHFPSTSGLRIEDINEVREKNIESFEYFLRQLKSMLDSGKEGRMEDLRNAIIEIAEAMRLMDSRYKEYRKKLKKLLIKSAIAGTTLTFGLLAKEVSGVCSIMSGIFGSDALKSLIDYYFEGKMPVDIRNDPFFIPWKVTKLAK